MKTNPSPVSAGAARAAEPVPAAISGIFNPLFSAARPQAQYSVPYGVPSPEEITRVLGRVHDYLAANTPARLVSRTTGAEGTALTRPDFDATVERGAFHIIGYEWCVTSAGMLLAAEATDDSRFREYAARPLAFTTAS